MIQGTDLMIGDYICYNTTNNYIAKIIGITQKEDEGDDVSYITAVRDKMDELYKSYFAEHFGVSIINPIPLTPEILKKNGFVQNGNVWESKDAKVYIYLGAYTNEASIVEIETKISHFNYFRIFYVHELQHIFRLCGNNKEIKL